MTFHKRLESEVEQVINRGQERLALSYWSNNFGVEGAQIVKHALCDWRNEIHELFLWGNRLDYDEWEYLSEGLTNGNCKVEVLGLEENLFYSIDTVQLLCKVLKHPQNRIGWLNISSTQLSETSSLTMLFETIMNPNCQVLSLFLDGNRIDDEGIVVTCNTLLAASHLVRNSYDLPFLRQLSLRRNHIGCVGMVHLIELVKQFPVPLSINVLGNNQTHDHFSEEVHDPSKPSLDELKRSLKWVVHRRGTKWFGVITTLLSVRDVPRLKAKSKAGFKQIPKEIIRGLADMLPVI